MHIQNGREDPVQRRHTTDEEWERVGTNNALLLFLEEDSLAGETGAEKRRQLGSIWTDFVTECPKLFGEATRIVNTTYSIPQQRSLLAEAIQLAKSERFDEANILAERDTELYSPGREKLERIVKICVDELVRRGADRSFLCT